MVASVQLCQLKVVRGLDVLRVYQFNTRTAKHYFCSTCGIHTHHQRRSNPQQYSYNVGCLEGVNPYDLPDVRVNGGVHHSADRQ